jgi:hypothetical protein
MHCPPARESAMRCEVAFLFRLAAVAPAIGTHKTADKF